MFKITWNSDIDKNAWRSLLDESPTASYFQTPECYLFYEKLHFMKPFAIAIAKDNDRLKALICGYIIADGGKIKKYMSRRSIIPGGALIANDCTDEELNYLLTKLSDKLKSEAIYTELRNYFDYSNKNEVFKRCGYDYHPHLNFHVATENVEMALKCLSSTKRRDVKTSLKEVRVLLQNQIKKNYLNFMKYSQIYITLK
ncbi:MAG: hypothetical protein QM751_01395 [Paludibacteraceae bacterium]